MTDDTKKILEELERELQEDDLLTDLPQSILGEPDEQSVSQVLDQIMTEPAFEDPDQLSVAQGNVASYQNYSNDYGQGHEPEPDGQIYGEDPHKNVKKAARQQDRLTIILMAIASFLSLGIICVLIYWLETFFG